MEYTRLFKRFQQLRPDDAPEDIDKLVELVENGTLKETEDTFVVCGSQYSESDELGNAFSYVEADISDWEPSSHSTGTIAKSEFEDGYFSVPGIPDNSIHNSLKLEFGMPRQHIPLGGQLQFPGFNKQ